jgi:hypothetical protein
MKFHFGLSRNAQPIHAKTKFDIIVFFCTLSFNSVKIANVHKIGFRSHQLAECRPNDRIAPEKAVKDRALERLNSA